MYAIQAAFYNQHGGSADHSNPYTTTNLTAARRHIDLHIIKEVNQENWVNVHKWLLLRCLIYEVSYVTKIE